MFTFFDDQGIFEHVHADLAFEDGADAVGVDEEVVVVAHGCTSGRLTSLNNLIIQVVVSNIKILVPSLE